MERSKPKSAKTTYENRYKHKLNMLWPGQIMLKIVGVFLLMGIPFWLLKWRVLLLLHSRWWQWYLPSC